VEHATIAMLNIDKTLAASTECNVGSMQFRLTIMFMSDRLGASISCVIDIIGNVGIFGMPASIR